MWSKLCNFTIIVQVIFWHLFLLFCFVFIFFKCVCSSLVHLVFSIQQHYYQLLHDSPYSQLATSSVEQASLVHTHNLQHHQWGEQASFVFLAFSFQQEHCVSLFFLQFCCLKGSSFQFLGYFFNSITHEEVLASFLSSLLERFWPLDSFHQFCYK